MHRALTLIAVAAAALALGIAPATAATQHQLVGIEVNSSPASFVGALLDQAGTWNATILHNPLNPIPGGTTLITGGSFSITTFRPYALARGTIAGGQITAGPVTVFNAWSCRQRFGVVGALTSGSFGGVLTHYGFPTGGACVPVAATFAGSVTL